MTSRSGFEEVAHGSIDPRGYGGVSPATTHDSRRAHRRAHAPARALDPDRAALHPPARQLRDFTPAPVWPAASFTPLPPGHSSPSTADADWIHRIGGLARPPVAQGRRGWARSQLAIPSPTPSGEGLHGSSAPVGLEPPRMSAGCLRAEPPGKVDPSKSMGSFASTVTSSAQLGGELHATEEAGNSVALLVTTEVLAAFRPLREW